MKPQKHEAFWRLYERDARLPIERACRSASRRLSDGAVDTDDMIAWVDTRVWRMLERGAWPTFHDDPTPEAAIARLVDHASTLARWAHLGLMRRAFREDEARRAYMGGMSRAERLSMVTAESASLEQRQDVQDRLDRLRSGLPAKLRQKLAASYPDAGDRSKVALMLGATRKEDDEAIEKHRPGNIKENTVQQMRSRARREAAGIFGAGGKLLKLLAIGAIGIAIGGMTPDVFAGEQTGGRKGNKRVAAESPALVVSLDVAREEEQTGGR
ncbi:MAG: hypothetical protein AAF995_06445 [Planctomycetota bacterium]